MSKSNGHHINWPKALHEAQEPAKELRRNQWLIPPLDIATHQALHQTIKLVPVPPYDMARRIQREFYPMPNDYLQTLDNLMFAVTRANVLPQTTRIEAKLGELMIASYEEQVPFIREGLIT